MNEFTRQRFHEFEMLLRELCFVKGFRELRFMKGFREASEKILIILKLAQP